jgi:hypothetical protein
MSNGTSANPKIQAWVDAKVGQPLVGSGECADLADQALTMNGCKGVRDFLKETIGNDYVWGTEIDLKLVAPGDVLQFCDHVVSTASTIKIVETGAKGTSITTQGPETNSRTRGHHTAIVSENCLNGQLIIVEQNVQDAQTKKTIPFVQRSLLYTQDASTTWKTTEPRADPTGGVLTVETTTAITVTVRGWIRAYRPQTKK